MIVLDLSRTLLYYISAHRFQIKLIADDSMCVSVSLVGEDKDCNICILFDNIKLFVQLQRPLG